ncbi:response regulator [Flavilitoribacter nigricans]|uniref:DNA-binding response regulator n=1 Tax=Flavilitoribacter nigricans (strain ATCC 23147 / DSM 23189 / NBRC 102662 / NCIMB 1420 / SS-2) TaxID=1122177 RepID=A0A2D0NCL8_FLAN2|nr:response regulator transcription factor [Flavilitoribacter nigricans]PHN06120.1 DNA-binding response regulator [Flavilitoribacter nigricans DSM 23189 = NBRC 102662]
MIKIGLIEDDQLVLEELKDAFQRSASLDCKMSCRTAEAFLKYFRGGLDVILLDVGLPGISGIEALPKILTMAPDVQVVMLTSFADHESVFQALRNGASGYLLKDSSLSVIEQILQDTHRGIPALSPAIALKIIRYFNQKPQGPSCKMLTKKEGHVLQLLVDGLSYKLIAGEMNVSINGIRYHIKNIYRKLHINSRSELFQLYRDGKISLFAE